MPLIDLYVLAPSSFTPRPRSFAPISASASAARTLRRVRSARPWCTSQMRRRSGSSSRRPLGPSSPRSSKTTQPRPESLVIQEKGEGEVLQDWWLFLFSWLFDGVKTFLQIIKVVTQRKFMTTDNYGQIIYGWKDFLLKNKNHLLKNLIDIMEWRKMQFVARCFSHVTSQILTLYIGPLKAENLDLKIDISDRWLLRAPNMFWRGKLIYLINKASLSQWYEFCINSKHFWFFGWLL